MSSLVPTPEWGDVPAWLQGAAEAGALYLAVRGRRRAQAIDWAKTLKKLSGLTDEELRRTIEDNPVIAEIVGRAWEAAAETASDDKRRLLAKVAAAALRGDAPAVVDVAPFLLRTVIELEPAHVTLLVAVGRYAGNADLLKASWPSPPDLLNAAMATLNQAGLVILARESAADLLGTTAEGWVPTGYGRRFLDFLQETGEAEPTN
jgi:hypothetical protein